jgi:presenilin-like A22 family membrane protease
MKHSYPITITLLLIFVCSQIIGLFIVNEYVNTEESSAAGKTVINEATYNITGIMPPQVGNESFSFIPILFAVIIGTVLILIIIRFRKKNVWRVWFFLSVLITMVVAFAPFIRKVFMHLAPWLVNATFAVAIIVSAALAYIKIFRPNMFVHNFTEVFVYGGIAALFVPILNLTSVLILLGIISVYDMWAVWKSKHMVAMAEFQNESKVFAGFSIPYRKTQDTLPGKPALPKQTTPSTGNITAEKQKQPMKKALAAKAQKAAAKAVEDTGMRTAILGGGDIAFPLLFVGVLLKLTASFIIPLIVVLATTVCLAALLFKGKSNTFYPAMPFITIGCLIGLVLVWGIFYGFSVSWLASMFSFGA